MADEKNTTPGTAEPADGNTEATSNTISDIFYNGQQEYEAQRDAIALTLYRAAPDLPQGTDFTDMGSIAQAFEDKVKNVDIDGELAANHFKAQDQIQGNPTGTEKARFEQAQNNLMNTIASLQDLIQSPDFQRIANSFSDFSDWINPQNPYYSLSDLLVLAKSDTLMGLLPYIADKLDEMTQLPEFESLTLAEFIRNTDEQGNRYQSYFEQVLNDAIGRRQGISLSSPIVQEARKPEAIQVRDIVDFIFPTDKPNNYMWNYANDIYLQACIGDGIYRYTFFTGENAAGSKAAVSFTLYFNDANERLTPYDKRVYLACFNLYNSGNEKFSINQIYKAMGNSSQPSTSDYSKISASLTKMNGVKLIIDTAKEQEVFSENSRKQKKRVSNFKKDAPFFLLRFYWDITDINGQICDNTVCLMEEPVLMTFARERKQITSVSPSLLLNSPRSKTPANLSIEDCLITHISHIKHTKSSKSGRNFSDEISFEKIYERCGLTTKKQKQDARKSIIAFLDSFTEKKFIKSYSIDTNKYGKPKIKIVVCVDEE